MQAIVSLPSFERLLAAAETIARTNSPVLITGESGTGKELMARALHCLSPRAGNPFVDVNCATLPEHLAESEFFGYEKGAFSGADAAKPGLFEAAAGGTLFLDEIGELSSHVQAKLLRVLDGQPWFRLGGTVKVHADTRIIAATNLRIERAVDEGRFRRDLYHRLEVFHLHVPALQERPDEIAPLAEFFLSGSGLSLSREALSILQGYAWPGNVRELKNVLLRAAAFAPGPEIGSADLPAAVTASLGRVHLKYSLEGLEQQTIMQVLAETNGHQQKAADLLGISRRTLIRKLKQYRSSGRD